MDDDGYIIKLTFLASVNFTPHKPYNIIVSTLTRDVVDEGCSVKTGKGILYRKQHCNTG